MTDGDLNEYLLDIEAGQYQHRPGTAGEVLFLSHPAACDHHRRRSLAVFARVAYLADGLWWPMYLAADPDSLSHDETAYIAVCWQSWTAGINPFSKGRRRVVA
jgi:hypothetical protein